MIVNCQVVSEGASHDVCDPDSMEPLTHQQKRHPGSLVADPGVITGTPGRFGQIPKLRPPLVFSRADADTAIDAALDNFTI